MKNLVVVLLGILSVSAGVSAHADTVKNLSCDQDIRLQVRYAENGSPETVTLSGSHSNADGVYQPLGDGDFFEKEGAYWPRLRLAEAVQVWGDGVNLELNCQ